MNYLEKLIPNPKNPRIITTEQFESLKEKIKGFPEMIEKRPIVYDKDYTILGGNQRFRALQELVKEGFEIKDNYFADASNWSEEKKRKFVIIDNISDGDWDYDMLANEWDDLPLEELGVKGDWGNEDEKDKDLDYKEAFQVVVECANEIEQQEIYEKLVSMGLKCKVLTL